VDRDIASGSSSILLASAFSKMSASLATYPHEVIRTRLQNQTKKPYKYQGIVHAIKVMSKEEGLRGFYKGLSTNLVRTVPSSAMTILTYELVVKKLDDWKNL
jgi:solute carrier family 25 folate transporter 32